MLKLLKIKRYKKQGNFRKIDLNLRKKSTQAIKEFIPERISIKKIDLLIKRLKIFSRKQNNFSSRI